MNQPRLTGKHAGLRYGIVNIEEIKRRIEDIRQARRNPKPVTRERFLQLVEQHRRAAAASRLGLQPPSHRTPSSE
jgi:hypothetical protein